MTSRPTNERGARGRAGRTSPDRPVDVIERFVASPCNTKKKKRPSNDTQRKETETKDERIVIFSRLGSFCRSVSARFVAGARQPEGADLSTLLPTFHSAFTEFLPSFGQIEMGWIG